MSYILEALKKSEQQREIGRVPGITSVHEKTAKSVSGKWYWLIAAILLLNAGLLVLLLWPLAKWDLLLVECLTVVFRLATCESMGMIGQRCLRNMCLV